MTIRSIINRADALRNNRTEDSKKIRWLSELESLIYHDIVLTHEGAQAYMNANEDGSFSHRTLPYESDRSELIAPFRFAKMYEAYLCCEIDLVHDEITKYTNDLALFNACYNAFAAWYNENHKPLEKAKIAVTPCFGSH